jgi:hypothetical protein
MYFCRVTKISKLDLERKTSVHYTGLDADDYSLNEASEILDIDIDDLIEVEGNICEVLDGLCGYEMESETENEAIEELQEFIESEYIPFDNSYEWHIFEGELSGESLPDGVLFIPSKIII